jgi:hypothetical protein
MSFLRTKEIPPNSGHYYLYMVHNDRFGDEIRQKVDEYLGRVGGKSDRAGGVVKRRSITEAVKKVTKLLRPTKAEKPIVIKEATKKAKEEPRKIETNIEAITRISNELTGKKDKLDNIINKVGDLEKSGIRNKPIESKEFQDYAQLLKDRDTQKKETRNTTTYLNQLKKAEKPSVKTPSKRVKPTGMTTKEKVESDITAGLEEADLIAQNVTPAEPTPEKPKTKTRIVRKDDVRTFKIAPQPLVNPFEGKPAQEKPAEPTPAPLISKTTETKPEAKPEPTIKKSEEYKLSPEMNKHIKSIENTGEKDYAQKYAHYLTTDDKIDEPQRGKLTPEKAKTLRAEVYNIQHPEEKPAAKKPETKTEVYSEPIITNAESIVVNAEPVVVNAEPIVVEVKEEKKPAEKPKANSKIESIKYTKFKPESITRIQSLLDKLPPEVRVGLKEFKQHSVQGGSGSHISGVIKLNRDFTDSTFYHEIGHHLYDDLAPQQYPEIITDWSARWKHPQEQFSNSFATYMEGKASPELTTTLDRILKTKRVEIKPEPTPKEEVKPEAPKEEPILEKIEVSTPKVTPEEPWKMTREEFEKSRIVSELHGKSYVGGDAGYKFIDKPTDSLFAHEYAHNNMVNWGYRDNKDFESLLEAYKKDMQLPTPLWSKEYGESTNYGELLAESYGYYNGVEHTKEWFKKKSPNLYTEMAKLPPPEYHNLKEYHKYLTKQAISEGKPVPPKVLKDYPDLVTPEVKEESPAIKTEVLESPLKDKVKRQSLYNKLIESGYSPERTNTIIEGEINDWRYKLGDYVIEKFAAPYKKSGFTYIVATKDGTHLSIEGNTAEEAEAKLREKATIKSVTVKNMMEDEESPEEKKANASSENIRSMFSDLIDEDKKSQSIKKIEKMMAGLDYDKYEGLEDVENAIEEYRSLERSGMSPEEYNDEKAGLFEEITSAIEGIEAVVEEETEEVLEVKPSVKEVEKPQKPAIKEKPATFTPQFKGYDSYIIKKEPDLLSISGFKYSVYTEDNKPLDISGATSKEAEVNLRKVKAVRAVIVKE